MDELADLLYDKLINHDKELMRAMAKMAMERMASSIDLEPNQPAPDANDIACQAGEFTKDMLADAAKGIKAHLSELAATAQVSTVTTLTWK
jgi:hypothetical protein